MRVERHTMIADWTEDQLLSLPDSETDYYEYKSSLIALERLKKEICVAASAFWNSGGGVFIAGVDDNGQVDGGVPGEVGSQKIRDWADQVLAHVEPTGPYTINTIEREGEQSAIKENHVVLVIAFGESVSAPHMAPDYRYYVRAGTHSLPAGHFLVEAVRSRRGLHKPFLRGLLQMHDSKTNTIQLVVLATNDSTALDVRLSLNPLPRIFTRIQKRFPLQIPVIDRDNPFMMDLLKPYEIDQIFGDNPMYLELAYQDIAGRDFKERQLLDPYRSLSPLQIGSDNADQIRKSLRDLVKQMKRFNALVEQLQPKNGKDHTG